MTPRKAVPAPAPAGMPHEVMIVPHSAVALKTGLPANVRRPADYPLEAVCQVCGRPVRREAMEPGLLDWAHAGPAPGG